MIGEKTVSVVCGCMDRLGMLMQALPTWLAFPEIDEVIVVDWSSKEDVETAVAELKDPRARVARVSGQSRWKASLSHNLGVGLASGDWILRLDADYLLRAGFFERHPPAERAFYCADWRQARDENELHLTGTAFFTRRDFFEVNGYNERIVTYGYEDDDLFERLKASGLERKDVDHSMLWHIPHSDSLRTENQDVRDVRAETARNAALAHSLPWTSADVRASWLVQPSRSGGWECKILI